jgi:hypothetical protein
MTTTTSQETSLYRSIKTTSRCLYTTKDKASTVNRETAGKKASRAIAELCPYNFADKPTYRTHQTDSGKTIILELEYSPVKRSPLEEKYQTINRPFTMLRPSAGSGIPDTPVTHEPVANGEYADIVGELKGPGINNLSECDMNTPTQDNEEKLFNEALGNKDSRQRATEKLKGVRSLRPSAQRKKGSTHPRTMKES